MQDRAPGTLSKNQALRDNAAGPQTLQVMGVLVSEGRRTRESVSALSAGGLWVWITVPWGQCHPSLLWVLSAGCPVLSHPENNRGWEMSPT